jgi:hypothetical protein
VSQNIPAAAPDDEAQIASHAALGVTMNSIIENARRESRRAAREAGLWKVIDIALGLPTAALAAVAGATGLASTAGRIPAAILALVAAALAAAGRFLVCSERANRANQRAAYWKTLATDGCLTAAFEGTRASAAEIRNQMAILVARQEAIGLGNFDRARVLREQGVGRIIAWPDSMISSACASSLHMPRWVDLSDEKIHPADPLQLGSRLLQSSSVSVWSDTHRTQNNRDPEE